MDAKSTYINNCINQLSDDQLQIEAVNYGLDPNLPKEHLCSLLSNYLYTIPPPPNYSPPSIPNTIFSLPTIEPLPSQLLTYNPKTPSYDPPFIPNTCSFCCEIQSIRSRYNSNDAKYCDTNGSCAVCRPSNYNIDGSKEQLDFARDIFQGIVLDIETKNIYHNMLSKINFLYSNNYMTPEQYDELTYSVYLYQDRYEEFINDIINYNRYKEPTSSGGDYIYLTGSFHWSQAIIILRNWFVTHFQEEFQQILDGYQSPSQQSYLTEYCKNKPLDQCNKPCSTQKRFGRTSCRYTTK